MSRRAVFLDRDGTLVEERRYPTREKDLVAIPGAGAALRRLSAAGYLCIVLTNQSAVARGLLDEERLGELHEHLARELRREGNAWDALYYCPHHPEGTAGAYAFPCRCRKPAPGLLETATREHDVDLGASAFIGDSARDLFPDVGPAAARILVRTGHPLDDVSAADHVADTVVEAVDWFLHRRPAPGSATPPA